MLRRKKAKPGEHQNLDRWLVSYADFITLLFAFFTVMYALSQTDKAKYPKAVENIQRSFLSAGGIFPLKGAPFTPFDKAPERGSSLPPSPADGGQFPKQDRPETAQRIAEQLRGLFEQSTGLTPGTGELDVVPTADGYKIRMGEAILYQPGSDKLKREYLPFIYALGQRLKGIKATIQVEGHTDSGGTATDGSRWHLSLERAMTLVRFFVDGAGVPPERLSLIGLGDTQPIGDNATPEGRARNRRVEVHLLSPQREISSSGF